MGMMNDGVYDICVAGGVEFMSDVPIRFSFVISVLKMTMYFYLGHYHLRNENKLDNNF